MGRPRVLMRFVREPFRKDLREERRDIFRRLIVGVLLDFDRFV